MPEVLLVVCSKKKNPVIRHRKHPCVKLSHSTLVFPSEARNELSQLFPDKTAFLQAVFPPGPLDEANAAWLNEKKISVDLDGEMFLAPFLKEISLLHDWKALGVFPEEKAEFLQRKKLLEKEWALLSSHAFPGKLVEEIGEKISSLASFPASTSPFARKRENLARTVSERFEKFGHEILELLRKPRDLSEIARLSGMSKSSARKWLRRMARKGVVAKTRKRHGVGRPRDVYYLSMRI